MTPAESRVCSTIDRSPRQGDSPSFDCITAEQGLGRQASIESRWLRRLTVRLEPGPKCRAATVAGVAKIERQGLAKGPQRLLGDPPDGHRTSLRPDCLEHQS